MTSQTFGDQGFRIVAKNVEIDSESPRWSAALLTVEGVDWSVGATTPETLGVIDHRLSLFRAGAAARHWGSFAGCESYEDVVERVSTYGYVSSTRRAWPEKWEIGVALAAYSLSACFDHNLGVEQFVTVRSHDAETLIWKRTTGEVEARNVAAAGFDAVLDGFTQWASRVSGAPRV